jgi:hypothetical protein
MYGGHFSYTKGREIEVCPWCRRVAAGLGWTHQCNGKLVRKRIAASGPRFEVVEPHCGAGAGCPNTVLFAAVRSNATMTAVTKNNGSANSDMTASCDDVHRFILTVLLRVLPHVEKLLLLDASSAATGRNISFRYMTPRTRLPGEEALQPERRLGFALLR